MKNAQDITYATAGVDVEAGDRAVELMKASIAKTQNAQVYNTLGGFAGLLDASVLKNMKKPLLATSTDGVGTKVAIAQAINIHDTIGQDLVAMVVDDLVVVGAKPLFMTDYIACGKVYPDRIADIVRGIAQACASVSVPLLGGETAEHPGLLAPEEYDVAGAATAVVDEEMLIGAHRVKAGDSVIGLAASGLHSNGYSLVRKIIEVVGWSYDKYMDDLGRTLGEELLEPTRLYTNICLELAQIKDISATPGDQLKVHGYAHITGGGLAANLSRVLPVGLAAVVKRDAWQVPPIFQVLQQVGKVSWTNLEKTLNLGIGMVAVVDKQATEEVMYAAQISGMSPCLLGEIVTQEQLTQMNGDLVQGTKGVNGGSVLMTGEYKL